MNDRLGIALCAIAMPVRFLQILAEFPMIVEFAVVNDPDVLFFVCNRLMPRPYIDNAETAHGQPDVLFHVETVVVRTPMNNTLVHLLERCTLDAMHLVDMNNPANSAHD